MQAETVAQAGPDPATRVWGAVSDHLGAFARAWEAGSPPDLRVRRPGPGGGRARRPARRLRPARPARAGAVRPGVPRPPAVHAAARRPEGVGLPRRRGRDARPARPPAHRPRVRPAVPP